MAAAKPNTQLRSVRIAMRMSQAELAKAIRAAGDRAGEPNTCSATQVQRWEYGVTRSPQGHYLRLLELVTGQPAENLGFRADEQVGLDTGALGLPSRDAWLPETEPRTTAAPLNGIWLSRYEYESSSRGAWFANAHYVMVLQHGAKLQARSLPGTTPGRVLMELTVNGQAVTGTWTEETNPAGYYAGATYHGAIQLLLDPTGHRMHGKWVGFGRDFELNTGPWTLDLVSADTGPEAMEKYNRPVAAEDQAED